MPIPVYKNWRSLIKPKRIEIESESRSSSYAKITIKPLERGFGLTLGNALRRILLSSLQGAAITSARIAGVKHEFSTVPGVQEDVSNILLNLKKAQLKLLESEHAVMRLTKKGPGVVTMGDFETGGKVEILNPNFVVCHFTDEGKIDLEVEVEMGKGFVLAEENNDPDAPVGTVFVDSHFAPVTRCNYTVTNARVGQVTDYDSLKIEIWTNGSITPEDALGLSSKILKDQVQVFINFDEYIEPEEIEIPREDASFNENLNKRVDELELSVRSANCLQNANIRFIGELVQKSESEMLRTKNFGRKSLNEIKEILTEMHLGLGMNIEGWIPPKEEAPAPVSGDEE